MEPLLAYFKNESLPEKTKATNGRRPTGVDWTYSIAPLDKARSESPVLRDNPPNKLEQNTAPLGLVYGFPLKGPRVFRKGFFVSWAKTATSQKYIYLRFRTSTLLIVFYVDSKGRRGITKIKIERSPLGVTIRFW
jgi:hypothetical protein